ncbi:hypothetical protein [Dictyobacter vulcani]|nr:hypothetical protein [Dictyobacter vulcani]
MSAPPIGGALMLSTKQYTTPFTWCSVNVDEKGRGAGDGNPLTGFQGCALASLPSPARYAGEPFQWSLIEY